MNHPDADTDTPRDADGWSLDPRDGVEHAFAEAWTFVERTADALPLAARDGSTGFRVPPTYQALADRLRGLTDEQFEAVREWTMLASAAAMREVLAGLESGVGPFSFEVTATRDAITQPAIGQGEPPRLADAFWSWCDRWRGLDDE